MECACRRPAINNVSFSSMDGLAVKGTSEQLLLLTLAATIDDVDTRMQQRCAALRADVCQLVKRIPEPTAMQGNPLALLTPPADETAEEEAQRLTREIKNTDNVHHKTPADGTFRLWRDYWGEYDRDISTDVRHAETKATLEKMGFHVTGWNCEWRPFCGTYVQWKSSV